MPNPWLILGALAVTLALVVGAYQMGYTASEGEHALQRQSDIETAWKAGAASLAAESARAQRAERERDTIAQRLQEITRAQSVPPRPDRLWTDAEFGLLESRRAAYAETYPDPPAVPLPRPVPRDAAHRRRRADHRHDAAGLGLGLPEPAEGMPGLGDDTTAGSE